MAFTFSFPCCGTGHPSTAAGVAAPQPGGGRGSVWANDAAGGLSPLFPSSPVQSTTSDAAAAMMRGEENSKGCNFYRPPPVSLLAVPVSMLSNAGSPTPCSEDIGGGGLGTSNITLSVLPSPIGGLPPPPPPAAAAAAAAFVATIHHQGRHHHSVELHAQNYNNLIFSPPPVYATTTTTGCVLRGVHPPPITSVGVMSRAPSLGNTTTSVGSGSSQQQQASSPLHFAMAHQPPLLSAKSTTSMPSPLTVSTCGFVPLTSSENIHHAFGLEESRSFE